MNKPKFYLPSLLEYEDSSSKTGDNSYKSSSNSDSQMIKDLKTTFSSERTLPICSSRSLEDLGVSKTAKEKKFTLITGQNKPKSHSENSFQQLRSVSSIARPEFLTTCAAKMSNSSKPISYQKHSKDFFFRLSEPSSFTYLSSANCHSSSVSNNYIKLNSFKINTLTYQM